MEQKMKYNILKYFSSSELKDNEFDSLSFPVYGTIMYRIYDGRNNQEYGCFLDPKKLLKAWRQALNKEGMPSLEFYDIIL